MDKDLRAFRAYLKRINTTSLKKLCSLAGFTDRETQYIVMYYGENNNEDYIADFLCIGVDAYHNAKMKLLRKLQHYCRTNIYSHETTSFHERMRLIDGYLKENYKEEMANA